MRREPAAAESFAELRGIVKRFGGLQALADVDLDLSAGEVHGLVGENGAGKSTLGKILGGVLRPDRGELRIRGEAVRFRSPADALRDGVAVVQQELALAPDMSVLDNVFMGVEATRHGIARRGHLRDRFAEISAGSGFALAPDVPVRELSLGQQQIVEILRALSRDLRLIVFDEPTAALALDEKRKLHALIDRLRCNGTTVVLISHFLDEVLQLSDRVTVMRNGRVVETVAAGRATPERLLVSMVGRELTATYPRKITPDPSAEVRLSVRELAKAGQFGPISFDLRAGEILGLGGLIGSGRSELVHAIFGSTRPDAGEVLLDGTPVRGGPGAVLRRGIGLVPESRKDQALVLGMSQCANVTLPHLHRVSRGPWVDKGVERSAAGKLLRRLDVRATSDAVDVVHLSGGNQQKVVFAKALFAPLEVLMLDEPTRGVDVGAKIAIYELVAELARDGMAILLISSELEELIGLAHRIMVLHRGRPTAVLEGEAMTQDAVMQAAFGLSPSGDATKGTHRAASPHV